MTRGRYSNLDKLISKNKVDAFIMFDTSDNKNQLYLTDFKCYDNFLFLRTSDKKSKLLVPTLEKQRAEKESLVDYICPTSKYEEKDVRGNLNLELDVVVSFLKDNNINSIALTKNVSYFVYNRLKKDFSVEVFDNPVMDSRKIKDARELDNLKEVQSITQNALEYAKSILKESEIGDDNSLIYNNSLLTSDLLRKKIEKYFIENNCLLKESIIVSGSEGSDPHNYGSGSLRASEPILIDIFPEHRDTKYWGDMTRTFLKGHTPMEVRNMYKATRSAFETALDVLDTNEEVTCGEIHNSVCDIYSNNNYNTIKDGDIEEGFIHSTGHGIGLDLHEPPRISDNNQKLRKGYVLTIEPGLYDKEYGAVRIEDMIVVTENGFKNLNDFSYDMKL